jgi:hypothetical protein
MSSIIEKPKPSNWSPEKPDLKGYTPESWVCVDCGGNTAPGLSTRIEMEQAYTLSDTLSQTIDAQSELYMVKDKVWKAAGMSGGMGGFRETDGDKGCLCIGCLEKRIGRRLVPKDFTNHPFNRNHSPCTNRLRARRTGLKQWVNEYPDGSHRLCTVGMDGEVTSISVEPMDKD